MPMVDPAGLGTTPEDENFFLSYPGLGVEFGVPYLARKIGARALGSLRDAQDSAYGALYSTKAHDIAGRAVGGVGGQGSFIKMGRRIKADSIAQGLMDTRHQRLMTHARRGQALAGSLATLGRAFQFAGVAALAFELGQGVFNAALTYKRSARVDARSRYDMLYNERPYADSSMAATQRQRALMVIHNSQLSTRAAFGAEADYLHS